MPHPHLPHLSQLATILPHVFSMGMVVKDWTYWADLSKHLSSWDRRTILMCEYVPKETKTLLEFGAGRCIALNYLSKDCQYIPSDLCDRGHGTIVCDLNRPLPPLPQVDIMMFSGVLEYIKNVPALIDALSPNTKGFLVSYCCTDYYEPDLIKHLGWHSISNRDFVRCFYKNGFEIVKLDKWENQRIYLFLRKNPDFLPA